ncbi:sigma-70 family RNA polymerase sigma factor [Bacillus sp. BHET2]|uniref:sigma-70 family RNA polymerase sigma factor n=1 Tax=Bacillus sp. BHET2 TaxID=2583818 RepID=UPI00110DA379|nr:sigma-70 family RNA polymerase sigma factor [Bacillus sp. BHET2]TMU87007.1 sigma-70 family RNA polymerase sigma factor [Bacillus sp. BHET2]
MLREKTIREAKRGDEKAFQDLIQIEKNKLYRLAYVYVKNEDDALDIVQDAIYKAFLSIKKLKEPQYFSTWLSRILIHSALDYLKKHRRVVPIEDMGEFFKIENLQLEDKLDLGGAIDRLDPLYKTAIILRYYKDLPIKEIAELLECQEGTVKTRIHRAINQLKSDLERGEYDERFIQQGKEGNRSDSHS